MTKVTEFDDKCKVRNIKTGVELTAEILQFREEEVLVVSVNRSVKLTLYWNERTNSYIGSMAGMEFQSTGPESYTYRTNR